MKSVFFQVTQRVCGKCRTRGPPVLAPGSLHCTVGPSEDFSPRNAISPAVGNAPQTSVFIDCIHFPATVKSGLLERKAHPATVGVPPTPEAADGGEVPVLGFITRCSGFPGSLPPASLGSLEIHQVMISVTCSFHL